METQTKSQRNETTVRVLRDELVLTQQQLADILNVDLRSVVNWEAGKSIGRKNAQALLALVGERGSPELLAWAQENLLPKRERPPSSTSAESESPSAKDPSPTAVANLSAPAREVLNWLLRTRRARERVSGECAYIRLINDGRRRAVEGALALPVLSMALILPGPARLALPLSARWRGFPRLLDSPWFGEWAEVFLGNHARGNFERQKLRHQAMLIEGVLRENFDDAPDVQSHLLALRRQEWRITPQFVRQFEVES